MSAPAKITDAQLHELRQRREAGALLKELSADFQLSLNYVCRLCRLRDRKPAKSTP